MMDFEGFCMLHAGMFLTSLHYGQGEILFSHTACWWTPCTAVLPSELCVGTPDLGPTSPHPRHLEQWSLSSFGLRESSESCWSSPWKKQKAQMCVPIKYTYNFRAHCHQEAHHELRVRTHVLLCHLHSGPERESGHSSQWDNLITRVWQRISQWVVSPQNRDCSWIPWGMSPPASPPTGGSSPPLVPVIEELVIHMLKP